MTPPRRPRFDLSVSAQRTARFIVGLGLIVYEAVWYPGEPRWLLIVAYSAMMGLPLANIADEVRTGMRRGSDPEAEEAA